MSSSAAAAAPSDAKRKRYTVTGIWTGRTADLIEIAMAPIIEGDDARFAERNEVIRSMRALFEEVVEHDTIFQPVLSVVNGADQEDKEGLAKTLLGRLVDDNASKRRKAVSFGANTTETIENALAARVLSDLKQATLDAKADVDRKRSNQKRPSMDILGAAAVASASAVAAAGAASAAAATTIPLARVKMQLVSETTGPVPAVNPSYPHRVEMQVTRIDKKRNVAETIKTTLYPPLELYADAEETKRAQFWFAHPDYSELERPHIEWAWLLFCADHHIRTCGVTDGMESRLKWKLSPFTQKRVEYRLSILLYIAQKFSRPGFPINIKVFTLAVNRALIGCRIVPRKFKEYDGGSRTDVANLKTEYHEEMEGRAYTRYVQRVRQPMPEHIFEYKALHPSDPSYFTDDEEEANFSKMSA